MVYRRHFIKFFLVSYLISTPHLDLRKYRYGIFQFRWIFFQIFQKFVTIPFVFLQIWNSFQCAMEVRIGSLCGALILAYLLLLQIHTAYSKTGKSLNLLYAIEPSRREPSDYSFLGSMSASQILLEKKRNYKIQFLKIGHQLFLNSLALLLWFVSSF